MNTARRPDLLDPYEVAQLGGVELVAEGVVEGVLAGLHRSPFRGFSVEFAEHRPYQPGDELRYLDWKMLARSDRLVGEQYEEGTNLRAMIVLDASRSMDWVGGERRLTKLEYAKRLGAALALVLLRQRDATGFVGFDERVRSVGPARSRRRQWWPLAAAVAALAPGGGTAAGPGPYRGTGLLRRRGLVLFISDLLLDPKLALLALRYLRHRGHQVIVFHIMDPAELTLEDQPEARFEDPESGTGGVGRPRELRAAYTETVRRSIREWRMARRRRGARGAGGGPPPPRRPAGPPFGFRPPPAPPGGAAPRVIAFLQPLAL